MVVIFLHIPKTAGTTLLKIINQNYDKRSVCSIYPKPGEKTLEIFKSLSEARKRKIMFLSGHFLFGIHELLPFPSTYITFLRDPVDRVISFYHFILRNPKHYLHNKVKSRKMGLEEFIQSNITNETFNEQTALIAGSKKGVNRLEIAKENIRNNFSFIGFTEMFDESLMLLKRTLGWGNVFYTRENVARNRPVKERISGGTAKLIEEKNMRDIELYKYARGLFEEKIREQGTTFTEEITRFESLNSRCNKILSPFNRIPFPSNLKWKIEGLITKGFSKIYYRT